MNGQAVNNSLNPTDYNRQGSMDCLTPYGYEQQRKLQQTLEVMQERHNATMTTKLTKVAELFELNVLSEEEALKACKVIIGQHAKVQGKIAEGEKGVTIVK